MVRPRLEEAEPPEDRLRDRPNLHPASAADPERWALEVILSQLKRLIPC